MSGATQPPARTHTSGSIERRIGSGLLITLLVTMTLLALLADYGAGRLSDTFITARLQHDADSLIKALQTTPDGDLTLDPQHLPTVYQRVQSGHYFQVLSATQRLRSRSLWEQAPRLEPLPQGQSRTLKREQGDERWLIWTQGVRLHEQTLTLWLAEDFAPLQQQWRRFTLLLYGAMLLATLGLLLIQRWLLRRSFDQINAVKRAIHQLQQGEIEALSGAVPSEIRPLTEEINHLVGRLEQRISRSRTAMGNLAHELKRSLQRLHLLQNALPAAEQAEYGQILADIGRLTERELQRARIAGTPHPGRRFAPTSDLAGLLQVLERIHPAVRFQQQIEAPEELPYDRDDMLELLGNLLDNAAKFGADRVQVQISVARRRCHLVITDNGPGVVPQQCEQLLERGIRIDESAAGHGLGLSICRLIVDSYAGQLAIAPGQDGGLQVSITLALD